MKSKHTGRGAKTTNGLFCLVDDERKSRGHRIVPVLVGHESRAHQLGAVRLEGNRWQVAAANGETRAFDLEVVR